MEAAQLETLIQIDAEGRLHGDAELLSRLKNQTFRATLSGQTLTLRPPVRRLSEIEDAGERAAAVQSWISNVGRPSGVSWPEDYNLRDDIYD